MWSGFALLLPSSDGMAVGKRQRLATASIRRQFCNKGFLEFVILTAYFVLFMIH
jgi:hypothetical protein